MPCTRAPSAALFASMPFGQHAREFTGLNLIDAPPAGQRESPSRYPRPRPPRWLSARLTGSLPSPAVHRTFPTRPQVRPRHSPNASRTLRNEPTPTDLKGLRFGIPVSVTRFALPSAAISANSGNLGNDLSQSCVASKDDSRTHRTRKWRFDQTEATAAATEIRGQLCPLAQKSRRTVALIAESRGWGNFADSVKLNLPHSFPVDSIDII